MLLFFDIKIVCYYDLVVKICCLNHKQKKAKLQACSSREFGLKIVDATYVTFVRSK